MVVRQGLSYSELVKLKKLWASANQFQKEKIIGEDVQNSQKSPKETNPLQNRPKKENSTTKTEDLHTIIETA